MVELQNASKSYRGIPAVQNVSFALRPGEVLGYLSGLEDWQLVIGSMMTAFTRSRLLRCTLLLAAAVGITAPAALAQAAVLASRSTTDPAASQKPLAFDVVSIRPDRSSTPGHDQIAITPNGWRMAHGSLMAALLTAYVPTTSDAMMYTVSTLVGVPDWMRTEMYNVDAKVADSDLAAWQNPATQPTMLRTMMQEMLAERCNLAAHRGSKEVTVYLLVKGKNGAKLKPAVPEDLHPGATPLPGGGEFLPNDGTGTASFYDAPIAALTVVLSNFAGRPVEDKTGLTGRYDMSFRRPRLGALSVEPDSTSDATPTVFEVVEGFGLKLQSAKNSVETLVIDHISKPSEN